MDLGDALTAVTFSFLLASPVFSLLPHVIILFCSILFYSALFSTLLLCYIFACLDCLISPIFPRFPRVLSQNETFCDACCKRLSTSLLVRKFHFVPHLIVMPLILPCLSNDIIFFSARFHQYCIKYDV